MNHYASITLQGLELSVNLGWPQGERVKQQTVTIDVTIRFANIPLACTTDHLEDTYCYDTLIAAIKNQLAPRHFRLLEHLGHEIYTIVKQTVTAARVQVRVVKKPAIVNLTGGVAFCYGDFAVIPAQAGIHFEMGTIDE